LRAQRIRHPGESRNLYFRTSEGVLAAGFRGRDDAAEFFNRLSALFSLPVLFLVVRK